MENLEDFLNNNNFQLDTYFGTNKKYRKEITDHQTLYVRIYSDVNKIVDVEYEDRVLTKNGEDKVVSFETIENIEQLKHLLKALNSEVKKDTFDLLFTKIEKAFEQGIVDLCPECNSITKIVSNPFYYWKCENCGYETNYMLLPSKNVKDHVRDILLKF